MHKSKIKKGEKNHPYTVESDAHLGVAMQGKSATHSNPEKERDTNGVKEANNC